MGGISVVVVGAGDIGRTAYEIIRALNSNGEAFKVLGFLDDQPKKGMVQDIPVLGDISWAGQHPEVSYVMAVALPRSKRSILDRLESFKLNYLSLIHPTAVVLDSVRLGVGVLINAGAVVVHDTTLGDFTSVNLNATVGHDCVIEEFVTIGPGANIAGRVSLGRGAFVGLNATVLESITVGSWATVGAGAVVLKEVPAHTVVFGNPARVVDRKSESG